MEHQFDHMENEAIPRYDKRGRLLTDEERAQIASRRGQCVRCGVHTHTGKAFRRKALTDDNVYNGICIRCNPEQLPAHVVEAWDLRNKPAAVVNLDRQKARAAAAAAALAAGVGAGTRHSGAASETNNSNTMSGMSTAGDRTSAASVLRGNTAGPPPTARGTTPQYSSVPSRLRSSGTVSGGGTTDVAGAPPPSLVSRGATWTTSSSSSSRDDAVAVGPPRTNNNNSRGALSQQNSVPSRLRGSGSSVGHAPSSSMGSIDSNASGGSNNGAAGGSGSGMSGTNSRLSPHNIPRNVRSFSGASSPTMPISMTGGGTTESSTSNATLRGTAKAVAAVAGGTRLRPRYEQQEQSQSLSQSQLQISSATTTAVPRSPPGANSNSSSSRSIDSHNNSIKTRSPRLDSDSNASSNNNNHSKTRSPRPVFLQKSPAERGGRFVARPPDLDDNNDGSERSLPPELFTTGLGFTSNSGGGGNSNSYNIFNNHSHDSLLFSHSLPPRLMNSMDIHNSNGGGGSGSGSGSNSNNNSLNKSLGASLSAQLMLTMSSPSSSRVDHNFLGNDEEFQGVKDNVVELTQLLHEHAANHNVYKIRQVMHCLRNHYHTSSDISSSSTALSTTDSNDHHQQEQEQVSIVFSMKDIMLQFIHDARIMDVACGVIWRVCADDVEQKTLVVTAGALDLVVDALRKNRNDYELATWAMGALTSIAYNSPENKAIAAQKGAIETVLEILANPVMRDWASVMEWACRCLYIFVYQYDDDACGKGNGCDHNHDDDHNHSYTSAVDCHSIVLKNLASMEEANGLTVVVNAMSANATEPIAQVWALKLLWRFLLPAFENGGGDGDDNDQRALIATHRILRKLVKAGYVPLAAKLLRLQSTTSDLLQLVSELLCVVLLNHAAVMAAADGFNLSLSSFHDDNSGIDPLAEAAKDCIAPLVRKMKESASRKVVPVQEAGCRLLSTLCCCTTTPESRVSVQAALMESAAPLAIVDAMAVLLEAGRSVAKSSRDDVVANDNDNDNDDAMPENSNIGILEGASWTLWELSTSLPEAIDATIAKRVISLMSKTYESSPSSIEILHALCGFCANVVCRVKNLEAAAFDVAMLVCGLGVDSAAVAKTASRSLSLIITKHASTAKILLDCLEWSEIVSALNDETSCSREYWLPILLAMAVQSSAARTSFQSSGVLLAAAALLKSFKDKVKLGIVLELLLALLVDQEPNQQVQFPHDMVPTLISMLSTNTTPVAASSHGNVSDSAFREKTCRTLTGVFLTGVATPSSTSRTAAATLMDIINSKAAAEVVSADLRMEACKSLWALVVKQPIADPLHPTTLRTMMETLVALMTRYDEPFALPIQEAATGALAGLAACIRQTPIPVEVAELDLMIADVYKAMALHNAGARVVGNILGAILNLCHVHEASLIQCGVIVVTVDSMVAYDGVADIQEKGCMILAQLASSENVQVNLSIVETDGIQILVGALVVFAEEPRIQAEACRAFSHLSTDDESRMLIVAQGGMRLIIEAVRRHPNHMGLLENAFTALLNLTSDVHEAELSDSGIINAIVDAMRNFPNSRSLRENGLGILQNVSMKGAPSKEAIAAVGGIQTVITAIDEFMGTPTVLERAFSTLWSLAVLPDNQVRIAQANGLTMVITAMFSSMDYERVQQQGCGCLCTLATHPDNRPAIRDADGASVIVFGMRAHFSSPDYQTAACRALSSISAPEHGESIAISQDEVNAVISAMRRFQGVEELQFAACCALLNFVLNPDLTPIASCLPEMHHAAETAMAIFPERCAEIAEQVIARLS
jgi:hypothetical protein